MVRSPSGGRLQDLLRRQRRQQRQGRRDSPGREPLDSAGAITGTLGLLIGGILLALWWAFGRDM